MTDVRVHDLLRLLEFVRDNPGLDNRALANKFGESVVERAVLLKLIAPTMKIVTNFVYPPIPDRRFDWSAVTEDYDGAEDAHCPVGWGRTEAEAIADLLEKIEERACP